VPSPTLEKKAQVIKTEKKAGFIFVTVSWLGRKIVPTFVHMKNIVFHYYII
jgi:hypothetical protein